MIEYRNGDILREEAQALVNTVNCVGIMGRGIALQFKQAYPENFTAYAEACKKGEVQPGRMFVFEIGELTHPRYIINFPTKRHWRQNSRLEDIESGLRALAEVIREYGIHSIAVPPLGCGLGGLDWKSVKDKITASLSTLEDVHISVYEPRGAPPTEEMTHNHTTLKMTSGRAALVELMDRYLAGLLDPFVSLLEVHKLMYFMQEAGEPLRLQYRKGPYGPYAENLRHVLNAIEGHLIEGYADGGDAPEKQLHLLPDAKDKASRFLADNPETRQRFDRVAQLVEGFESPFGLELLSTVHWVVNKEHAHTPNDIIEQVYAWNQSKRKFSPRQIQLAARVLKEQLWITGAITS